MGVIFEIDVALFFTQKLHPALNAGKTSDGLDGIVAGDAQLHRRFNGESGIFCHKTVESGKIIRLGGCDHIGMSCVETSEFRRISNKKPGRISAECPEIFFQCFSAAHAPFVIFVNIGDDPQKGDNADVCAVGFIHFGHKDIAAARQGGFSFDAGGTDA